MRADARQAITNTRAVLLDAEEPQDQGTSTGTRLGYVGGQCRSAIAGTSMRPRCDWTPADDATLTSAVAATPRKKRGTEHAIDWKAVHALVGPGLGRTKNQCFYRWHTELDPSIDREAALQGRKGHWTAAENIQLQDAVRTYGSNHRPTNWDNVAALVPGRTKNQCRNRWNNSLDPSIDLANAREGRWTAAEDRQLTTALQTLGRGFDWDEVAALVSGRTRTQCRARWNDALKHTVDRPPGRVGHWTADETMLLQNAVEKNRGNSWHVIATLVPGRTGKQCKHRWQIT
jgi:hypothetical protein